MGAVWNLKGQTGLPSSLGSDSELVFERGHREWLRCSKDARGQESHMTAGDTLALLVQMLPHSTRDPCSIQTSDACLCGVCTFSLFPGYVTHPYSMHVCSLIGHHHLAYCKRGINFLGVWEGICDRKNKKA